jgi:hypothetical protein
MGQSIGQHHMRTSHSGCRAHSGIAGLIKQPVGLKGNRLQIRLSGPYFAAFLVNRTTIDLQNRQVG